MEYWKKIGRIKLSSAQGGFSLIELLIVLSILSMLAGIALPSVAVFNRRQGEEKVIHQIAVLCQETFQRAVFSGQKYVIEKEGQNQLVVFYFQNFKKNRATDFLLRPVEIPPEITIEWPEDGWRTMPEGYCEQSEIALINSKSGSKIRFKFRPFDARMIKVSK